ncbi:MAG: bifunctional UDP-N-acetylglucosamine diphosphorylase/glucosamine-1-phosphate N-acetyltransferase GlmU [Alphaproteobacteria bacterium]|nr:bifunctional UDP-N-acetylglucosamine diphosphorylase/glucosamine-1-phosphate N-acetyltransferase GlmU [Alphaproteobacteria bacterium]
MPTPFAAIILAAGMGTRMKSALPKVMHAIAGQPMIRLAIGTAAAAGATRTVVVIARGMTSVEAVAVPHAIAFQDPPRGTGDAVRVTRKALKGFVGDVVVLYGDTPLIEPRTIASLLTARRQPLAGGRIPAVAILGMRPREPRAYGRIKLAADGTVEAIIEFKDATPEERKIGLCNSGVMAIDGQHLFALLDQIEPRNEQGEYYLTDIVRIARDQRLVTAVVEGSSDELMGVDSRAQLAVAEGVMQARLRARAMAGGVTMIDPRSVTLAWDTTFGRDVVLEPNVVFGPGAAVGNGVMIRAFSHIENATIDEGAVIGPFARLRPGAHIGKEAHIGNFVEVKKSQIEPGAKVNHLTYIGDARVGRGANVGAGTITCNYDGYAKHHTDIGAGAFIGSNVALVAPVSIGDGAVIGAGSVIARDVPAGAFALTRADQKEFKGWAERRRKEMTMEMGNGHGTLKPKAKAKARAKAKHTAARKTGARSATSHRAR